jgi:hypothetical protein
MNEQDAREEAQDRLTRTLRDRATDAPHGAPIGFDDVRSSARRIRRRQRVTTGLAAAAVLAIAVPVGLTTLDTPRADGPVAPASNAPSPSAPSSTDPAPGPTPTQQGPFKTALTLDGAEAGAAPAVTFLRDRTVVTPEGGQQELPAAYDTIAPYRGGWLAVERREGTPYVVQIDAQGSVVRAEPGGDSIAVSTDGLELSWVEGQTLFLDSTNGHSEAPTSLHLPVKQATPVGFVSAGSVVFRADGPKPKYSVTNFAEPPLMMDVMGLRAVNQTQGLLGVQTSYNLDNGTSCWKVATNRPGDPEPKSCDWTIQAFSADGEHLVGYPSGTDGLGSGSVALLDSRTMDVVARFDRPGQGVTFVNDVVWEDDSHVVASLYEADAWHLVRLGLDGTIENLDSSTEDVDGPAGSPEESIFHFAARP